VLDPALDLWMRLQMAAPELKQIFDRSADGSDVNLQSKCGEFRAMPPRCDKLMREPSMGTTILNLTEAT
jgi:hypothetical protein